MSLTDLARELEMSIPGVGYAVEKGETIVQDNKYQLIGEIYFIFLRMSPFTVDSAAPYGCDCTIKLGGPTLRILRSINR